MTDTDSLPPPPVSFAERVNRNIQAEILVRRGVPKPRIADALHKTVDALDRRLRGKQDWPLADIEIVAGLVGVDPAELTK